MTLLINRDGKLLAEVADVNAAVAWLHRHQPQSYDWAIRYEGYSVEREDGTRALESYSEIMRGGIR